MTGLFPPLDEKTRIILHRLPYIIDKAFPMPGRFRPALPANVAELSRLLTSARTERGASYLGKPALLSAYLRYFLPWNVYRLSRLLVTLPLKLKPNDAINDLGAGPLTLAAALWISRPELRDFPLEFRCVDRTAAVLEAGKKFFTALTATGDGTASAVAAGTCPWKLIGIRGEVKPNGNLSIQIRGKTAALSAVINLYNELFWNFSPMDFESLDHFTEKQARLLASNTDSAGSILVVEPGIPRSGEFISLLRSGLTAEGFAPLSPCTHSQPCAFPNKAKWCHFAFDTEDAPGELHRLSAAAGIPKERAVLSFIFSGGGSQKTETQKNKTKIRVVSDPFQLDSGNYNNKNTWGRYGCSERGPVLVTGSRKAIEALASGVMEELQLSAGKTDAKSRALIAELDK